jgi:hypothetical protein
MCYRNVIMSSSDPFKPFEDILNADKAAIARAKDDLEKIDVGIRFLVNTKREEHRKAREGLTSQISKLQQELDDFTKRQPDVLKEYSDGCEKDATPRKRILNQTIADKEKKVANFERHLLAFKESYEDLAKEVDASSMGNTASGPKQASVGCHDHAPDALDHELTNFRAEPIFSSLMQQGFKTMLEDVKAAAHTALVLSRTKGEQQ